MKRLLVAVLMVCTSIGAIAQTILGTRNRVVAGGGIVLITYIQSAPNNFNSSVTSLTMSSVGANHVMIGCIRTSNTNVATSVTGTLGETYTQVARQVEGTNSSVICYLGKTTSGGSDTITFNGTWASGAIGIYEFANATGTVSNVVGCSVSVNVTGSICNVTQTVPNTSGIIFAAAQHWLSGDTVSTYSPFTLLGLFKYGAAQYYQPTSTGTQTVNFSVNSGGHGIVLSFFLN